MRRLFGQTDAHGLFQGRLSRIRRRRKQVGGESRADRHEGRRALRADESPAGGSATVRLRLSTSGRRVTPAKPFADFDAIFAQRRREADEFYAALQARHHRRRRAHGSAPGVRRHDLVQSNFFTTTCRSGSRATRHSRRHRRNASRVAIATGGTSTTPTSSRCPTNGSIRGIAAWDLAFHCIPLALIDAEFAKGQLVLLTREWYMHPNGQLPAYEWAFGDVNPPVHAWAAWRVFQIDRKQRRESIRKTRRSRVSRARVSQADAQFHLVGESQGRAGPQHFPGRLPRPRQHRRVRPQRAAADRRLHQPGRRHELDGDVFA